MAAGLVLDLTGFVDCMIDFLRQRIERMQSRQKIRQLRKGRALKKRQAAPGFSAALEHDFEVEQLACSKSCSGAQTLKRFSQIGKVFQIRSRTPFQKAQSFRGFVEQNFDERAFGMGLDL